MFILKYKNFFLALSALAVLISLFSIFNFGLKKSIDFTGGTRVIVTYPVMTGVTAASIQSKLVTSFPDTKVISIKDNTFKITMPNLAAADYEKVNAGLKSISPDVKTDEFTVIGPSISSEVTSKAILGFILLLPQLLALYFLGLGCLQKGI